MSAAWTEEQKQELERASRTHPKAHIRTKAKAVLAVAKGNSQKKVAELFDISAHTIGKWVCRYRQDGLEGFNVKTGRGRKAQADPEELKEFGQKSPRDLGLREERWMLRTLEKNIPSLRGLSLSGIWRALRRAGLRYDPKSGCIIEIKKRSQDQQ